MSEILSLERINIGSQFRAYGLRGAYDSTNPFIGVDHAWMSGPTFPPHPHQGFSAVSYLFLDSETGINNRDSIGTKNLIKPGGLHWTTAGKGIVHEEVPAEIGKTVHSLQIFINLPSHLRETTPGCLILGAEDVPTVHREGVKVRVPLGHFEDVQSPLTPPTEVTILDISLEPNTELVLTLPPEHSGFLLAVYGEVRVDDQTFKLDDLQVPIFKEKEVAQHISLKALERGAKLVFFSGQPLSN
ncbi:pirin family protein [Acinetobacter sp. ANC 4641]